MNFDTNYISMNYQPWINYCLTVEKHIVEALDLNEVNLLQSHLLEIGAREYVNWLNENRRAIESFLSSSPTKDTKDAWNTDQLYSLKLFLSGAQFARSARVFLEALDQNAVLSEMDLPEMLLSAKQAYSQIVLRNKNSAYYWPFDDICKNPFGS